MKFTRLLVAIALLPVGCVQGPQQTPASTGAASSAPARSEAVPSKPAAPATPEAAVPEAAPSAPAATVKKAAPEATPAPKNPPEPTAPKRARLVVPAGTLLPVEIQTALSTANSREGDPVLAVLTEDVALDGFKLDKGAEVRGRVLTAVAAKRVKGQARLVVGFDAVMENGEKLSIATETIDTTAASTSGKDKKIIAGGAVGGLILGALKDGKKGAAIGTAAGAAAGTGAVLIMKGDEVEIPRGAKLTLTVTKP